MSMITEGAEKILNAKDESVMMVSSLNCILIPSYRSLMIDADIDDIIQRGEARTTELNSKYEGLNLDDLNNFKSDATVQQWEGEDFRTGVSIVPSLEGSF